MKVTISKNYQSVKDKNRKDRVVIYNTDIKEMSFKELYDYCQIASSIKINDKKYGLPRLYQYPRIQSTTQEYFLQSDKNQNEKYINILTLDYDKTVEREYVEGKLSDYEYISYYSYSHNLKEGNRFRIILNLSSNVDGVKISKKVKQSILSDFEYEGDIPDSASIKDGWMALPALYDGIREADVKYNIGDKLDLNSIIDKKEIEMGITGKTRTKINNKIDDSKELNIERQQKSLDELIDILYSVTENKHNAITEFISKASWVGIEPSEIRTVIYDYETNESKIENWIELIDKWNKKNVIPYYYRYEYRSFKGDDYLYDNLKDLYYDSFTKEWLVKPPRKTQKDYLNFMIKSELYKLLYRRLGDFKLAKKTYEFIQRIMEEYNPEDMITRKQYSNPINKGVYLPQKIYRVIMFEFFRFREIEKENVVIENIFDVLTTTEDDQKELLKVLKELVWVRREILDSYGRAIKRTYFSPKNILLKIYNK